MVTQAVCLRRPLLHAKNQSCFSTFLLKSRYQQVQESGEFKIIAMETRERKENPGSEKNSNPRAKSIALVSDF